MLETYWYSLGANMQYGNTEQFLQHENLYIMSWKFGLWLI